MLDFLENYFYVEMYLEEHVDIRDESFIVLLYHLHDKRRDVLATRIFLKN